MVHRFRNGYPGGEALPDDPSGYRRCLRRGERRKFGFVGFTVNARRQRSAHVAKDGAAFISAADGDEQQQRAEVFIAQGFHAVPCVGVGTCDRSASREAGSRTEVIEIPIRCRSIE